MCVCVCARARVCMCVLPYIMIYVAKIRIHASFNSHDSRMLYDSRKYEKKYFYKYLLYCIN